MSDLKVKVLFLAANPISTSRLRLDSEARDIESKIRVSEARHCLELRTRWAVTPDDLIQALNEDEPEVVHFSGHGAVEGVFLDDGHGGSSKVSGEALAGLFKVLGDRVRVVILNSCYSGVQASNLLQAVDCVIGMPSSISDQIASVYSSSFYRGVGFRRSVQNSHEQGLAAIDLLGFSDAEKPELYCRDGIDPRSLFLVPANKDEQSADRHTISNKIRSVLWVDDEGDFIYRYELSELRRRGWEVVLARSVVEAAHLIHEIPFSAIIVDLVLPFSPGVVEPNQGAWGGYTLISWLYTGSLPEVVARSPSLRVLNSLRPNRRNKTARLVLATAFASNDMLSLIDEVSPEVVEVNFKPVDFQALLMSIAGLDG